MASPSNAAYLRQLARNRYRGEVGSWIKKLSYRGSHRIDQYWAPDKVGLGNSLLADAFEMFGSKFFGLRGGYGHDKDWLEIAEKAATAYAVLIGKPESDGPKLIDHINRMDFDYDDKKNLVRSFYFSLDGKSLEFILPAAWSAFLIGRCYELKYGTPDKFDWENPESRSEFAMTLVEGPTYRQNRLKFTVRGPPDTLLEGRGAYRK